MPVHTVQTAITASNIFTSTILVQGYARLNVGIMIGSIITSAGVPKESVVVSTFSGIITLQRQMVDDASGIWRDVEQWSVAASAALGGASENITVSPEPESCKYRLGCKIGDHYAVGLASIRLGCSGGRLE